MVMAGNIQLDLRYNCIEGISFSLTKGFYGCERLRIGVRMKREYEDDGIDICLTQCLWYQRLVVMLVMK